MKTLYTAVEMSKIVSACKNYDELFQVEECYCFLLRNQYVSVKEATRFYILLHLRAEQLRKIK